MSNKKGGPVYPEPFVVQHSQKHKQSLILLHGRGSNGEKFGTAFLKSQITQKAPITAEESSPATLAEVFPNAKFIFPTARKRRARWYNRATINQWFDGVPINEQDGGVSAEEEAWQLEGLRQSREFLKSLVDAEVSLVGAANVFIRGLSQGCAMSLHLLLSYDESAALGGFVGTSGWLPCGDTIEAIGRPRMLKSGQTNDDDDNDDNDDDPFATSDDEGLDFEDESASQDETNEDPLSRAVKSSNLVRENIDLPAIASSSSRPSFISTPVFLGHGKNDEKVKIAHGLQVERCLKDLGLQVTWREYDEGHWYKIPEEIDDIIKFLHTCLETRED